MLKYIVFLASIAAVAHGQQFLMGGCPAAAPMANLNITKMTGDWYPMYRVNSPVDNGKCIKHTITDVGFLQFLTTIYKNSNNVTLQVMGFNIRAGSLFLAIYPLTELPIPAPYTVFTTDYTTYAIGYFCFDLGFAHIRILHIYVRDKTNSAAALSKAYADLDTAKIERASLLAIDQTCL